MGFPVTDFETNIWVKVVYFRSDPRKTHVGSGQVRKSRKETNKKCVSKKVTAFATGLLLSESPWETELFQLTGKGTGSFIYPFLIQQWLRVESKVFGLLFIWPQYASIARKRP